MGAREACQPRPQDAALVLLSNSDNNPEVESLVSTRTGLLQALRSGPAYGLELVARIEQATGHRIALGSLYPTLEALTRAGLARAWKVVPGGQRGARSRTYHELTHRGYLQAEDEALRLSALLNDAKSPRPARTPSRATLSRRLARVSDLIAFAEDLHQRRPP